MSFRLVIFFAFLGVVFSAPVSDEDSTAQIKAYEFVPNAGDGSYKFSYETSNGLHREEVGTVKISKDNKKYIAVEGYYTYYTPEGKITVNYEADEDGYRQTLENEESVGLPASVLGSLVGGGLGK